MRAWLLAGLFFACGTSQSSPDASADAGGGDGASDAQAAGPCSDEVLASPRVAKTIYVAMGEPGADDDLCDGSAPRDEGGGRCPFKSLAAIHKRGLASNAKAVRVELRAGTYVAPSANGLGLSGGGANEAERLVLSRYRGEAAILDVGAPTGAGCVTDAGASMDPACARQVLNIGGSYTVVQGLTIRNGLAHHVLVTGDHVLIRCNKLEETADFPSRSDQMKIVGSDVEVRDNELTKWRSQAMDITGASRVTIEGNDFHDPTDRGCGATGIKYGSKDVIVRRNRVHDVASPHCTGLRAILGGGGTGSPHMDEYSARRVHVVDNVVERVNAPAAVFGSCEDCSFEGNVVEQARAGVWVAGYVTGDAGCATSPMGCKPSAGMRVSRNRIRDVSSMSGAVFVAVDAGEASGLIASENKYCLPQVGDARFGWAGALVTFAEWTNLSKQDTTSLVLASSDPRCGGM